MKKSNLADNIAKSILSYKNYTPYLWAKSIILVDIMNRIIISNHITFHDFISINDFEKLFNEASQEEDFSVHRYRVLCIINDYYNKIFNLVNNNCTKSVMDYANIEYTKRIEELDARYNTR